MAYSPNVWKQLKNLSKGEFISALFRDGWQEEPSGGGSERLFIKSNPDGTIRAVAIHFHHGSDTFGRSLAGRKVILSGSSWSVVDDFQLAPAAALTG